MLTAVKFVDGSETNLEGLLLPFGGVHNGADLYGEKFTKATDFCLSWTNGSLPLLFHHGLDPAVETEVVGRIKAVDMRDDGGWMQAQLDASAKYFESIKELVKAGKLFLSSGAMAHLVKVNSKSGEIERWPLVEGSLTPTPANLLAQLDFATAARHYKSAGIELPAPLRVIRHEGDQWVLYSQDGAKKLGTFDTEEEAKEREREIEVFKHEDAAKAVSMSMMREMVADLDMDMSESEMRKMIDAFPNHDEAAMRKALQTRKQMGKSSPPLRAVSWEDVRQECAAMLNARMAETNMMMAPGQGAYCYVEETYSDHVICCVHQGGQERYYSIPFARADDGHIESMGSPIEVEETYTPVNPGMPMGNMPMEMHAEMVRSYAASLVERTKDLRQRRLKEGRMISDSNRRRLMACMEQMSAAMTEMQGLLDSSAPQPAKAAALRRQADKLRLFAATLPQN